MKKSFVSRLVLAVSLCTALFIGGIPVVSASSLEAGPQIMPRAETINYASSKLIDLKDGTVGIYVTADGTTKVREIDVETTLQKKTLLWWSDVETFTDSAYDNAIVMDQSASVDAGTYRLHSEFTFISDITETHDHYSNQVTIK